MRTIYYVADREQGNYVNLVTFFSSKKKLDAYIKEEKSKGNEIKNYFDDLDDENRYYWDEVLIN